MARSARTLGVATVAIALIALGACSSSADNVEKSGTTLGGSRTSGTGVRGLDASALAVMNQPEYANGRWAISVRDIDTGETLIDIDADKMAELGSAVKSYSMGAGWLEWGPDHRIVTPVKRTGEIVGGTVQGDLVLVGQGDITMGGRTKPTGTVDFTDLDHNDANPLPGATLTPEDPLTGLDALAAQVKSSGINAVNGQVVVDDRLFQSTLADEPITPIVINQNLIDLTTTPGAVGAPATIAMSPKVAPWTVTSKVETVAAGGAAKIAVSSTQEGQVVLTGTIPVDSAPVLKVYALEDPSTFARTAFIEALGRAGVTVGGDPVAVNVTAALADPAAVNALPSVAELQSLPLAEDATYVLKVSYNRGAQTIVCQLAVAAGTYTTKAPPGHRCDGGLERAATLWGKAGLDTKTAALIDGSGLEGNLVTPTNQTQLQTIMAKRPDAARWKATLPILGRDGSLTTVQTKSPSAGKVFAKTGTLVGDDTFNGGRFRLASKALGGYIDTEKGRHLAFSIVVNQGFFADIQGVFDANDDVGAVAASIQQQF